MYKDIVQIIQQHMFELWVGVALLVLVLLYVYNNCTNKSQGTWTEPSLHSIVFLPRKRDTHTTTTITATTSKGEVQCRQVLERMFGKPFTKCRPAFLKNQRTGANLELDCYNDELKLGLEYNGAQHYHYSPFFHANEQAFADQKYRDELKRALCAKHGVRLIEVPYTVKPADIEAYIHRALTKLPDTLQGSFVQSTFEDTDVSFPQESGVGMHGTHADLSVLNVPQIYHDG